MDIVGRMVKEWSEKDDSLLHGTRMAFLEHDPSGLRLKTEGNLFLNAFVGGNMFQTCIHIFHIQLKKILCCYIWFIMLYALKTILSHWFHSHVSHSFFFKLYVITYGSYFNVVCIENNFVTLIALIDLLKF